MESYFYSIPSLIILIIGIIVSFAFGSQKGERYVVLGILLSVGIHFLPFHTFYTYVLAIGVVGNVCYSFVKEECSIYQTILIDALLKIIMGIFMIVI